MKSYLESCPLSKMRWRLNVLSIVTPTSRCHHESASVGSNCNWPCGTRKRLSSCPYPTPTYTFTGSLGAANASMGKNVHDSNLMRCTRRVDIVHPYDKFKA